MAKNATPRYQEDTRSIEIRLAEAKRVDPNAYVRTCRPCGKLRVKSNMSGVGDFSKGQWECRLCQQIRRDAQRKGGKKSASKSESKIVNIDDILANVQHLDLSEEHIPTVNVPELKADISVSDIPTRFITIQRGALNVGNRIGRFAIQPSSASFIYFEDDEHGVPVTAEVVFPITTFDDDAGHHRHVSVSAEGSDAVALSVYADAFSGIPQAEHTLQLIHSLEQKVREQSAVIQQYRDEARQLAAQRDEIQGKLIALRTQLRSL